jgi:regulator of nucleoside diphosphate kinase
VVNRLDRDRLYATFPFTIAMSDHARGVFGLLGVATPLPARMIPPDLVTMNTVVCVRDLDTGQAGVYDLVYPGDADGRPLGRSITAPFGAALFGRYVGEQLAWHAHDGERRGVIDAIVYQPEREGHHDR